MYQREPRCSCGGSYAVDIYRLKKENAHPCNCGAWWFPHRPGSHKQAEERDARRYAA